MKDLTTTQQAALRYIRNQFVHHGHSPTVREVMQHLGFSSPNSAQVVILGLMTLGLLKRNKYGDLQLSEDIDADPSKTQTIDVPLIGSAACGNPMLAEEEFQALIPVSVGLAKPPHKYFLLRADGDSMNQAGIQNGDLVLVRQQQSASNGDKVVALIDDDATIKEIKYSPDATVLLPRSDNSSHQPIVLTRDFLVQGIVVATVPGE